MTSQSTRAQLPNGITAVGTFLFFGAAMASLAATTLLWRGTALDRIWALNPRVYRELVPFGKAPGILFLLLGVVLVVAGVGWFKRRIWGWRLAVAIIAAQVLGDLVSAFMGRVIEGVIGIVIASALLLYLLRPKIRATFVTGDALNVR